MDLHGKTIYLRVLLLFFVFVSTSEPAPFKITDKRSWLCLLKTTLHRLTSPLREVPPGFCDDKGFNRSNIGQLGSDSSEYSLTTAASQLRSRRNSEEANAICDKMADKVEARWFVKNVTVEFPKCPNSDDRCVKISWTPLSVASSQWTGYYFGYTVGEFVDGPSKTIKCFRLPKNQTSKIITSADGYCYPERIELFVTAIPRFKPNDTLHRITFSIHYPPDVGETGPCSKEPGTDGPSKSFSPGPSKSSKTVPYVAIVLGTLAGLGLVAAVLLYAVWRSKKSIPLPPGYEYHAFVCFSSGDTDWVKTTLLPFLEETSHLKCCVHYRDFVPGIPFRENMANCVYKSYKTIAVYSSSFLQSEYCNYELEIAIHRLVEKGDHSLVVIRIDNSNCSELPKELKKRSFIDYASTLERAFWKKKLLNFLAVKDAIVVQEGVNGVD